VNEEGLVPSALWNMMPNPATDQFTLSLPLTNDLVAASGASLTAQVFTAQGVLVGAYPMQVSGSNAVVTIPTTSAASGTYYVHVTTTGGTHVGTDKVQIVR
jgi:hypothetical protein